MTTINNGKRPGPKPTSFIPSLFRAVMGVEQITTRRQFVRLREFMGLPSAERPPYMRLGASVPARDPEGRHHPTATYAVSIEGEILILKRDQDPRAAERWMSNPARPWNLAKEFACGGGGR